MSLEAFLDAVRDSWRLDAACRGMDPEVFHNVKGQPVHLEARAACAACTVRFDCLSYAVNNGIKVGYWGGRTPRQRNGLRSRIARGEVIA